MFHEIGDVKPSLRAMDHSGWYLMNGRELDDLPTSVHNRAYDLGFLVCLPDCTDCVLGSHQSGLGIHVGSNVTTLQPQNLPDVALDVDVAEDGDHTHVFKDLTNACKPVTHATGSAFTSLFSKEWTTIEEDDSTHVEHTHMCKNSGSHAHEGTTTSSMNDGEVLPFSVRQKTFGVNFFLYLGV